MCNKQCNRCNVVKDITEFRTYKKRGISYTRGDCKECLALIRRESYNNPKTRAKELVNGARNRSLKMDLPFDLTPEWLLDRLTVGVCEVTGIPLVLDGGKSNGGHRSFTPSLDRTDPTQGYTMDNVKVVCWIYNGAKGVGTHEDVMKLVEALANV